MKSYKFFAVLFVLFMSMAMASSATTDLCKIIEPLLGVEITSESLIITVCQTGGTQQNSFRFEILKKGEEQVLTVIRVKADHCKMMPQRETYTYPIAETGLDSGKPVTITNKIYGNENIAKIRQRTTEETDSTTTRKNSARSAFDKIMQRD